ncbi:MAG: DUF1080 domain-containing protein [Planctomycetaceae bacterium]
MVRMDIGSRNLLLFLIGLSALGCGPAPSGPPSDAGTSASSTTAEKSSDSEKLPVAESPKPGSAAATVEGVEFVAPPLSTEEIKQGWISLFDGRSLFGWDVPAVSNWHVEDNAIVVDSGDKSLLLTPYDLDDYELRCDFHLSAGGNSGLFLRTALNAANPATDTYELNICDSHPTHKTGSLVARHIAENVPAVEGAWHSFRVICEGPRIQVWLDGQQIVDFTDTSTAVRLTGRLGLQMNQGRAAYRNVCVRPLKFRPLLNGQDTTGWRPVPGSKSEFAVKDGLLHVSNGPGFLETEETFSDFAMKVEARINGDGLNSGVFFRAQPGTEAAPSHGYEMQLHNGVKDGDRSKPADSGTGAIFRRVAARYVPANDREFLTAVLIAQGDRFASWVNGYQVVNWQDTREPNSNPRQGKRLDAGHLSLQGHDPTTDLDFKSVDVHTFSGEAASATAPVK